MLQGFSIDPSALNTQSSPRNSPHHPNDTLSVDHVQEKRSQSISGPAPKKLRLTPTNHTAILTQNQVQLALNVVSDPCLMDSAKTLKLRELILETPELARHFENCWKPQFARFECAPDWKSVEKSLFVALTRVPSEASSLSLST